MSKKEQAQFRKDVIETLLLHNGKIVIDDVHEVRITVLLMYGNVTFTLFKRDEGRDLFSIYSRVDDPKAWIGELGTSSDFNRFSGKWNIHEFHALIAQRKLVSRLTRYSYLGDSV
jgi:hypothetical protein